MLGQGSTATVRLINGAAVKVVHPNFRDRYVNEVAALRALRGVANIVAMYDCAPATLSIRLQVGSEMISTIHRGILSAPKVALKYSKELVSAVAACHARGIRHRDLKPDNFLLDANARLLLADFGTATFCATSHEVAGTVAYAAPEIAKAFHGGRVGPYATLAVDLWSLGICVFIFVVGFPPFQSATVTCEWYRLIYQYRWREFWATLPPQTSEFKQFIESTLDVRPESRADCETLLASAFCM